MYMEVFTLPPLIRAESEDSPSSPSRVLGLRSGKLAYVVFAGNDLGVFYNWYVFFSSCKTNRLAPYSRTATATAISGLENSRKVYKGYTSYEDAHSAWDEFAGTGCLPHDVAATLGSKPYPTPPISATARVSAPPTRTIGRMTGDQGSGSKTIK